MTRLLAIFLFCFAALGASPTLYVSKDGDNSDGLSWATAKNELDQIVWGHAAGDILQIDGGVTGMVYSTIMTPNSRGAAGNPVIIKRSTDANHDGPVYFTPTASGYAILLKCVNNLHDIRIDGGATNLCFLDGSGYAGTQQGAVTFLSGSEAIYNLDWRNMTVRYWSNGGGIYLRGYSNGITFANMNFHSCGGNSTSQHDLILDPVNYFGIGTGCTITNCYFGDNYGINDCIESASGFEITANILHLGDYTTGSSADGIYLSKSRDVRIIGNLFIGGSRTNQMLYVGPDAGNTCSNVLVANNIFYCATPNKDHWGIVAHARSVGGVVYGLKVVNNTFYNIGNAAYYRCDADASYAGTCLFEGNMIHTGPETAGFQCLDVANNGCTNTVTFDYNWYDSNSGVTAGQIIRWLGSNKTLAQAQAVGFVEIHGQYGNPGWVNTNSLPGGLYFDYSAAKPPRYYAPNQSAYFTTDKNGTTRPGVNPWTIGAVECASDLFPLRGHLIPKP